MAYRSTTRSGIRMQGYDTLFPQNSYCIRCERGLSSFDTRNRLVVSPLYELPVGKGKLLNINNCSRQRVHRRLASRRDLDACKAAYRRPSPSAAWTTPSPKPDTTGPNATGHSSSASNPSPAGWYNPAAFVEAPVGQFGNVGRDTAIAPGIFSINAEIHKNFRMPYNEHHQLQFRVEAFNRAEPSELWRTQRQHPGGRGNSGPAGERAHQGFGTISGLAFGIPMRQLQLGLKYTF